MDGTGQAVCTSRTTHVEIRHYADIDQAHAGAEGEGDRTLSSWQRDHRPFLDDVCDTLGIPFDADLELVLDRFDVVDPPAPDGGHP